ncbi:VanZ family protein [Ferrovibrio sp.]|uniref:VanZ family protein n=1 Tax=Ferrovibrio sp. TaxID=1917215 RepID=UPI0035B10EC9
MTAAASIKQRDFMAWLCWGLAVLLVAAFANSFPLWLWLSDRLGAGARFMPFALAGLLLAGMLFARMLFASHGRQRDIRWLAAGLLAALLGLVLADPDFPAKRVHVAEYALLALVLRRAVRPWFTGGDLVFAVALLGFLAGLHDEAIQGLLPSRSYGLRDILVDGLGAIAGACIAQGLGYHSSAAEPARWRAMPKPLLAPLAGAVLLALALPGFEGNPIPPWSAAPLLAGCAVCLMLPLPAQAAWRGFMIALLLILAPLALYPVLSHVPPLVFR